MRPGQPSLPDGALGMRGGLGKTLLLAFLLLAIFPLGLLAFLTYNQIQHDTRDRLLSSLETMVALKEAHLEDWIDAHEGQLALLARGVGPALDGDSPPKPLLAAFDAMDDGDSALTGVVLVVLASGSQPGDVQVVDQAGWVPAQVDELALLGSSLITRGDATEDKLLWVERQDEGESAWIPAVSYVGDGWVLVGLLSPAVLQRVVTADVAGAYGADDDILTSLVARVPREPTSWPTRALATDVVVVSRDGTEALSANQLWSEAIGQVLSGAEGGGAYLDPSGVEVFGAYRWSGELGVGLVAEKRQAEALAAGDDVTAWVVAATLGAALLSAAMAAVVTRRVTRPIVELTETAAWLARGDLSRQVVVTRRDEVGVLGRAFNRMAAELRVLYGSLEAKVEERTQAWREANEALEEANEYTRYYVMQLAISAEVARVATSIRDLAAMLETVVELIGRAFELHYVAIYLVDATGEWAVWRVGTAGVEPAERRVVIGGPTLVGRAASSPGGSTVGMEAGTAGNDGAPVQPIGSGFPPGAIPSLGEQTGGRAEKLVRPDGGWELAIPLRVRGEVLGVLVLESASSGEGEDGVEPIGQAGWVPESDWVVYQSLADQISIAIENARAYALERETVERLRELDRIQAEFLTNMSHALRTPLNSIIGFSRVMLKEIDGPLSDMQRADLVTIYEAGRQLLGLLNDMLDLSQLEMGALSWSPSHVDIGEVIEGVMATTHALARNKPIQLRMDVADALPVLHTDGQRVRQVILALLSNAVKFTDAGIITLRAHPIRSRTTAHDKCTDGVAISVAIEGMGNEAGLASVWWQGVSGESNGGGDVSKGATALRGTTPAPGSDLPGQAHGFTQSGNGQETSAGFGLMVSKRVVEKLGGEIWLHRDGDALEFRFTLPVTAER